MHQKGRIFSVAVLALLVLTTLWLLFRRTPEEALLPAASEQLQVVVTLFPLYDMAQALGGEEITLRLLLPPGIEPHSFEPAPQDIVAISEADVFLYVGPAMEMWAHDILQAVAADIIVVDSSARYTAGFFAPQHNENDHQDVPDEHHSSNGNIDPHLWLDFEYAQLMIEEIMEAFITADGAHANLYRHRAAQYISQLQALDSRYQNRLAHCKQRTLVYAGHWAFGYLAQRYQLQLHAAYGISPDAEPSAQDVVRLIEIIRRENISTIFYEEILDPAVAKTLAQESGATLLALNPGQNLTSQQFQDGIGFIEIMERNLAHLATGLECG